MPLYRVLVTGENFLVNLDSVPEKMGFFTGCFVEAASREQAETVAIDLVRHRQGLVGKVLNAEADQPLLFASEIQEVDSWDEGRGVETAFAWYPEGAAGE